MRRLFPRRETFHGSADYWESRYQGGGNSGDGSFGRLAAFKAEFLNDFVASNAITSVIEFGCGDGNQLGLARYPQYIGLDVAHSAVVRCRDRFASDSTKSFFLYASDGFVDRQRQFHGDLSLSLDVIYHLVEDRLFDAYMHHLFAAADRFVVVYSTDHEEQVPARHVRHRRFSDWVSVNCPDWTLTTTMPNRFPTESNAKFFVYEQHRR